MDFSRSVDKGPHDSLIRKLEKVDYIQLLQGGRIIVSIPSSKVIISGSVWWGPTEVCPRPGAA